MALSAGFFLFPDGVFTFSSFRGILLGVYAGRRNMMKKKLMRWACAAFAAVLVAAAAVIPGQAATGLDPGFIPQSSALELIDLDSGGTIYAKDADKKVSQASTTKVMTFIVANELIHDPANTMATISADVQQQLPNRSFVTVQLAVGEKISALNLMYCMLVPSGNDAAIALAESASGSNMAQFVKLMNAKAKALGCTNTNYTNVFGNYNKDHYTTAHDLEKIYKYAYSLPLFRKIASCASYTVPATNYSKARQLAASNKLLVKNSNYYDASCTGGKSGTSDQAGYCLASTASKNGMNYLCVAMGAPSVKNGKSVLTNGAFEDSRQLYDWAFSSLKKQSVLSKSKSVANVTVQQTKDHSQQLAVMPAQDFSAMLPTDGGKVTTKVSLPKSVAAPVKAGQKIGTIAVSYNGQTMANVDLVASQEVSRHIPFYLQPWFKVVAIIVIVAAAAVLIFLLIRFLRSHGHRGGGYGGRSWNRRSTRYSPKRGHHSKRRSRYKSNYHLYR
ncbi:hypothetical protein B6259_06315 [Ruminococcaceae bacterium CPB6]|jgi:D-alanyl-D-alanine carboxypeptidase (penicillin-binding protein 5/6)|uniref:serine-type D-Ala-D-Ala carboxypeptidase n=2 Tax=Oscillospiraceae TaxID=216572 RepID=A0A859DPJ7_9FIRM|nr:hypothetical protein B6259_06315 [Ruminococcaceae bacterium CPB6]QKN23758.1 hypothetical protein GJQ69_04245 [Caproicibacterium lactatifermentans]QKO29607.1 hypothetical protein GKP14_00335 [Caproicibacterium lactatifermentans]